MPTYDYRCNKCEFEFELFQSMNENPVNRCPSCGGSVKRLIGAGSGLIFKGTGFYITDYKNKKASAPSEKKGKDEKPKSEKKVKKEKKDKKL